MIDDDFVKRAQEMMKPLVEEKRIETNEKNKAWRKANPDKWKESQNRWRARNKKRIQKYSRAIKNKLVKFRYHFLKNARETLPIDEWFKICDFYLNCPEGYTVDHIIPISRGGKHIISNLQYLTRSENSKKSNKFVEQSKK